MLFDSIINKALSLDPELINKLAAYQGRVIEIDIQGYNRKLYLLPHSDGMQVSSDYVGVVDTTLRGTPAALFKMALHKDVAPLMLRGEVEISGDLKLGRAFKKTLAEMQIDWEGHTASIVGDVPTHYIKQSLNSIVSWGKRASNSFKDDVSDYLQEESRDVVSAAELEGFYEDVDRLRDDVERLEARIMAAIK